MERPDRVFVQDLKRVYNKLDCYLSYELKEKNGYKDPLYVITQDRAHRAPVIIRIIHDGNYGFRKPSQIDIDWLIERDTRRMSMDEQMEQTAYIMEKARELKEKSDASERHDRTKDGKYLFKDFRAKHIDGNAKGHKHVRRIIPKPKNNTYKVIDRRKLKTNNASS